MQKSDITLDLIIVLLFFYICDVLYLVFGGVKGHFLKCLNQNDYNLEIVWFVNFAREA